MNTSSHFSPQRFFLVLKRHLVLNQKTFWVGLGAVGGLLLMLSVLQTYLDGKQFALSAFSGTGITMFFIFGFIFASMIFKELHNPARSQFLLILPASSLEKTAAAWLISAPLFALVFYLILMLVSLLASAIASMLFGTPLAVFNPFEAQYIRLAGIYLVTHSIFFLGAVYFRKNNFLKTLLALFVFQMILSLFAFLVGYLFFGRTLMQFDDSISASPVFFIETVPTIARIIFWGLLAPFFLVVSYFRFKEREV